MAIQIKEQRMLFLKSGNRCGFSGCRRLLTAAASPPDRSVVLGEVAHIVAKRQDGPRGNYPLPMDKHNQYDNLILLCNQHHQLVDSQPQTYTIEKIRAMKEAHEKWVEETLGMLEDKSTLATNVKETVYSTLLPIVPAGLAKLVSSLTSGCNYLSKRFILRCCVICPAG